MKLLYRRWAMQDERRSIQLERHYSRIIFDALMEQANDYITTGDIQDRLTGVLGALYEQTMLGTIEVQQKRFEALKSADFFLNHFKIWIAEYIAQYIADKVVGINATTRERIQAIIDENPSVPRGKIAKLILSVFGDEETLYRARMIARTEVGNATNAAKRRSGEAYQSATNTPLGKLWIHRGAKDPRDWHQELDTGTPIPIDEPFQVYKPSTGEYEPMDRPHDPAASAENVINCGCQVMYVPLDYQSRRKL